MEKRSEEDFREVMAAFEKRVLEQDEPVEVCLLASNICEPGSHGARFWGCGGFELWQQTAADARQAGFPVQAGCGCQEPDCLWPDPDSTITLPAVMYAEFLKKVADLPCGLPSPRLLSASTAGLLTKLDVSELLKGLPFLVCPTKSPRTHN